MVAAFLALLGFYETLARFPAHFRRLDTSAAKTSSVALNAVDTFTMRE